MTRPGETQAGSAGMQPCPGIARWKLIEDDQRRTASTAVLPFFIGFDRFPHALKIPARRAADSLTQIGFTPIPAEPRQFNQTASAKSKAEQTEEVLVPLRELLKTQQKSVWLCSSKHEANRWGTWVSKELKGAVTWELSATGDELEVFCAESEGHLFIAGRFEGMDFPDETCRLAILPSLPIATGALERFTTEQLKDASFQRTRMLERIKQGIGRCTRGANDYAVYYLLDSRFHKEMDSKPFAALLSDRARRQIEVGLELTQDGMGAVVPFATRFLSGDFAEFDKREVSARPPAIPPDAGPTRSASVTAEVNGWRALFESRDFVKAAHLFEEVRVNLPNSEREHRAFWTYMQAQAEYLRYSLDEEEEALGRCLNLLKKAIEEGGSASWFNRLRKAYNKLAGVTASVSTEHEALLDWWDELVETHPYYKGRFLKWQARLKEFLDGTHNQVCEALETLGRLLGFNASRPPETGAPDGLWLARDHAITLEAKIDMDRDFTSLADVNQADGHRRSLQTSLKLDAAHVAAVLVTDLKKIDQAAQQALGTIRILRLKLVADLQSSSRNCHAGLLERLVKGRLRQEKGSTWCGLKGASAGRLAAASDSRQ